MRKSFAFTRPLLILSVLILISCEKEGNNPDQEPSLMISGSRAGHYVIVDPITGEDIAEVAPDVKYVGQVSLGYMSNKTLLVSPVIGGGNPAIFSCDPLTGNQLSQLTSDDDFYIQHIDGSPVAARIVFSAKDTEDWDLHVYTINEDGSGSQQLSYKDESIQIPDAGGDIAGKIVGGDMPSWSPDGSQIAFNAYIREIGTNYAHNSIIVMDSDGSNKQIVYDYPNKEEIHYDDICWTRDGAFLIFSMADGSIRAVRALHISSGTLNDLHLQMEVGGLGVADHWTSPTQDKIVYMLISPGGSNLYIISYDINGQNLSVSLQPSQLTDEQAVGHGYSEPDWEHWDLD